MSTDPRKEKRLSNRRSFLLESVAGLGSVALSWMLADAARADAPKEDPDRPPHHPASVKRVIQIFACGGVSHLDTFDHKPELIKRNGQEMTGKGKVETFFGQPGRLLRSP